MSVRARSGTVLVTRRRGHHLWKAIVGVVAMLAVTAGCVVLGVHAARHLGSSNSGSTSALDRFADGRAAPTVATVGDAGARMTVDLPSPASAVQRERMPYLGVTWQLDRVTSAAGNASAQILWFRVLPNLERDRENLLVTLAAAQTVELGGTAALDARHVGTGTAAAYDFEVDPATPTGATNYSVQIMVHDGVVYIVRVEAPSGSEGALTKLVKSIVWVQPARR